ncbi:AAEL017088-PA [Aedes aegypti]|uniref:AAEL017088-PA n=1 Tax=Aedes aegypti TaxID=7159 RepID=J9HIE9_AEDAE|nr:AAEL017088-PA [Aedes aegypti]
MAIAVASSASSHLDVATRWPLSSSTRPGVTVPEPLLPVDDDCPTDMTICCLRPCVPEVTKTERESNNETRNANTRRLRCVEWEKNGEGTLG